MAAIDKTGRMIYAVSASLVLHALVLGTLVAFSVRPESTVEPTQQSTPSPAEEKTPEEQSAPSETVPKTETPAPKTETPAPKTETPAPRRAETPRPETPRARTPSPKPPSAEPAPTEEAKAFSIHIVRKGESLTAIAAAHGCTLQDLKQLNQSSLKRHNNLFVGQKIKVPRMLDETTRNRGMEKKR